MHALDFIFDFHTIIFNIARKSFNEPIIMLKIKFTSVVKLARSSCCFCLLLGKKTHCLIQGRRNWGEGARGAAAPVALYQEGQRTQRCPFNLKDCLGEIAKLVELFYEFASENARNAVIELQE